MPSKPMRLPPLKHLRVKNPNKTEKNPCTLVMSSVLACWASQGYNTAGCTAIEQALRECMDTPKPAQKTGSSINYHLARMYKNMVGPRRR
ncbi:hypothetical protein VTK73DRAFT_1629 [Phialemonium thermophilum]|uniref:Small ribosomal subunit protein mS37 n=1 Tax=Phialemonium thermophilum TaxID=223376 RepID=A0ABR3VT88_9PEZI